jgi:hypothetical protein
MESVSGVKSDRGKKGAAMKESRFGWLVINAKSGGGYQQVHQEPKHGRQMVVGALCAA